MESSQKIKSTQKTLFLPVNFDLNDNKSKIKPFIAKFFREELLKIDKDKDTQVFVAEIPNKSVLRQFTDFVYKDNKGLELGITETHPVVIAIKAEDGSKKILIDDSRYGPSYCFYRQVLESLKKENVLVLGRFDAAIKDEHIAQHSIFNGTYNSHISVFQLLDGYNNKSAIDSQFKFIEENIDKALKGQEYSIFTEGEIVKIADKLPRINDKKLAKNIKTHFDNIYKEEKAKIINKAIDEESLNLQDCFSSLEGYAKTIFEQDPKKSGLYKALDKAKGNNNQIEYIRNRLYSDISQDSKINSDHPFYEIFNKIKLKIEPQLVELAKFKAESRKIKYPQDKEFDGNNPTNDFVNNEIKENFCRYFKILNRFSDLAEAKNKADKNINEDLPANQITGQPSAIASKEEAKSR